MQTRDLAQPRQVQALRAVCDAPRADAQRQVPAAVVAFDPAEAVTAGGELEWPGRFERETRATRDLGDEPVETVRVDRVLQPRMLARPAIAEIALGRDDGFGDREQLLRPQEADDVGDPRIGRRIAVAGAEPATNRQVEADQLACLDDGDEAEVVCEYVHVVDRRHRDRRLELARQVGRTVDRLDFLGARNPLAVEPDLVVRAGAGQQELREPLRPLVGERVRARFDRIRTREHVAVDVAAGRDGIDQRGVDRRHGHLELGFDDAVELERLPRRDAQRPVGMAAGDLVQREPLRRRADAARQPRANHEAVRGLELLLAALLADVAVVLLVAAVELDQHGVVLADRAGQRIGEALDQRATQQPAVALDALDG